MRKRAREFVLVVDDDQKTVASIKLYLEHNGYEVAIAGVRATEIDEQILALVKGKKVILPPSTFKVDPAALAKFVGSYKLPSGAEVTIAVQGDSLFVAAANQEGFDLLAGARHGNPEQINRMNWQVREILEAGAKGDHTLLHKLSAPRCHLKSSNPGRKLCGERVESGSANSKA